LRKVSTASTCPSATRLALGHWWGTVSALNPAVCRLKSASHSVVVEPRRGHNYLEKNDFFVMECWHRLQKPRDTISIILDSSFFVPEQINLFAEGAINIFAEPVMNVLQERNIISKALDEMHRCDPTVWIKILKHFTQGLYSDVVKLVAVLSLVDRRPECGPFAYPTDGFLAFMKMGAQISLAVQRKDLLEGRDEWTAQALEEISVQWSKVLSHFGDDLTFFLTEL
ncbi:hypothetical protein CEXT_289151, partial [Caerostris extrusa]